MRAKFINEGAWGHYPLDNDSVSDWKWDFAGDILKRLKDKINKGLKSSEYSNWSYLYYSIGLWEYFKVQLKTNYSFFKDDEVEEMDNLTKKAAEKLLEVDYPTVGGYSEPEKVTIYLKNYVNQLSD